MNRPRTIPGLAAALLLAACEAAPPPPPAPVVSPPPVAAPAPAPPAVAPALAFDDERASAFARLSLECIGREYPNKPGDTLSGDPDVLPPRRLHPAFFGCFDWHSAVHGHWALTRILATRPGHPLAGAIRAALANSFTPEKLAGELAYFRSEGREIFERPYGWGWFLRLHAELVHAGAVDPELAAHARTLEPLARLFAERIGRYLERLSVLPLDQALPSAIFVPAMADGAPLRYSDARDRALDQFERGYLEDLLRFTSGNVTKAADLAGVSRRYLTRLIAKHQIDRQEIQET